MEYRWFSISPRLKDDGAFAAFDSVPSGHEIKPRRLTEGQPEFADYEFSFKTSNLAVDASLGIAGIVDIDASIEVATAVLDIHRYSTGNVASPGMDPELVELTRWGAGLRVHFTIRKIEANAKVNTLAAFAASAELGQVRATYCIETFGISDPGIVASFPGPGRFDAEVAESLVQLGARVKNEQFVDPDKRESVPFQIYAPHDLFQEHVDHARSVVFAVQRIAEGERRSSAITAARVREGISEIAVARVYGAWGLDGSSAPESAHRERAKTWLGD